jgi:hypothetical protein
MNITVDDTSPNFVWSGGDVWRGQAPTQATLNDKYFLRTYHAAQSKGANVSITFVGTFLVSPFPSSTTLHHALIMQLVRNALIGSSIQIYGSKGLYRIIIFQFLERLAHL